MELKTAHIVNFGKLSNFEVDFSKGLNSFIYENGWGKTTLSVFIKAMFYGMEYTTSSNIEKNERLKYYPWQGGKYGGSLSFSHNGKDYMITRFFLSRVNKDNKDTFELRDLKTNKTSVDYTENLGTELFGISRDTYERSIHVILDEFPENTNDISARLNHLIENDDVSAYDTAMKKLNYKAGVLKKTGKKGELFTIQNDIDLFREKIKEIDSKLLQNDECEKKIKLKNDEVEKLKAEQAEVTSQLSESARYEGKLRYEQLKNDENENKKRLSSLLDFFNNQLPENAALAKIDELITDYKTLDTKLKDDSLTQAEKNQYEELKKSFGGDIPTKEQIDSCLDSDNQFRRFKEEETEKKLTETEANEYSELKQRFSGAELSEEEISKKLSDISELQNLKNDITRLEGEKLAKKAELELQRLSKRKNPVVVMLAAFSLVFAGAGASGFAFNFNRFVIYAAFGFAVVFLLFALISFFAGKKDGGENENALSDFDEKLASLNAKCEEKGRGVFDFISRFVSRNDIPVDGIKSGNEISLLNKISIDFNRYSILHSKSSEYFKWLQGQPKLACDYENELKLFVTRFCKTQDISAVASQIQILNERLSKLLELEGRVNADEKNVKLFLEKKEKLMQILAQYKSDKTLDLAGQVQQIHDKMNDIKNVSTLLEELHSRVEDFENDSQNDVKGFETLKKPERSAEDLRSSLSEISEQINHLNSEISSYRRIIEANLSVTDKRAEIEGDIERLEDEKKEKTEEHKILMKTMELLSEAKENLDANYSDPMKNGFEKYVNMITLNENENDSGQKLLINTDLKVMVDVDGEMHEGESLSAGYRDLVNFCSRMALIDALFSDIKPPVILDDPFVNLDDEKLEQALALVAKLAEEKQVLYFACHKSRVVSAL